MHVSETPSTAETTVSLDDVRQRAPDQVAAAAFAARAVQSELLTVAAFAGELEHIVLTIADPVAAELRLQWWRDAVVTSDNDGRSGHPLADDVRNVLGRLNWPHDRLHAFFDAYADALYDGSGTSDDVFVRAVDVRFSEPMRLAAAILGAGRDHSTPDCLIAPSARAYGLMQIALTVPHLTRLGRMPLPASYGLGEANDAAQLAASQHRLVGAARKALAEAAPVFKRTGRRPRVAVLPVAAVEPHLRALERVGRDSPATIYAAEIAPLVRFAVMACAQLTGRLPRLRDR